MDRPFTARMQLAEYQLGRPLVDFLAERKANKLPLRQIARDLADATDGATDITEVTLRSWLARLALTEDSTASTSA